MASWPSTISVLAGWLGMVSVHPGGRQEGPCAEVSSHQEPARPPWAMGVLCTS